MAEYVIMPKLGFNMREGQVVKWHKSEGDLLKKGEVLFEIMTDKTTIEIEATSDGIVKKLLVEEGETIPVGLPIAIIGGSEENIKTLLEEAYKKLNVSAKTLKHQDKSEIPTVTEEIKIEPLEVRHEIRLTPRAKRFINKENLDIAKHNIEGTGCKGGITERDVKQYLEKNKIRISPLAKKIANKEKVDVAEIKGTGIREKIVKSDIERYLANMNLEKDVQEFDGNEIIETVPYTGMRKIIGDRLSISKFTAPHLYFTYSSNMSTLLKLRKQINENRNLKISITDFIIAAASKTLQEYPMINSTLSKDNNILQFRNVNIGVAVALDDGLIVPVIKNVQTKKIAQISEATRTLIKKARSGRLMPKEYKGGTFTVSNLGMFGVHNFTAIINPPETAILSISAIIKKPVVITRDGKDDIVVKPVMNMTLSVDHRIIDGLVAAKFIHYLGKLLESPIEILI